ncbi:putative baseplate assembly protein [Desulfocucumis palustris]|nr:putative baseplate assembly protein [Desulfocucumis palustris]
MQPPLMDSRDINALINHMKNMFPFYTPEWRFTPGDPDPGTALFLIFADMFQENIKRFNRVPLKNFIAFLNMFNVSVMPAKPARSFVSFRLSPGAGEPVFIPAGTQVSAEGPEGEAIIFETEKNILATPSSMVAAFNTGPALDSIFKISEDFFAVQENGEKPAVALFDFSGPDNLQEHSLYLGHADLFNIRETALVELEVKNSFKRYKEPSICQKLVQGEYTQWSYRSGEGWQPFDQVFSRGNKIILKKATPGLIEKKEVQDIQSRWIRCRLKDMKIHQLSEIEIDGLGLSVDYCDCEQKGGVTPDMAYYNDVPRDTGGFYPLGEFFVLYDMFYLASQEVFSKKGSLVTIKFILGHRNNVMKNDPPGGPEYKDIMKTRDFAEPQLPEVSVLTVSWEYWNGNGWIKLFSRKEYEEIFYHPRDGEVDLTFNCPLDMQETYVNDQLNYWIRARVLSIENVYTIPSVYRSPWIENIKLTYRYHEVKCPLDCCMLHNNMEYRDMTAAAGSGGQLWQPFYSLENKKPAFYLGFDRPPVKGPLSLLFSIKQQKNNGEKPILEWEYLSGAGGRLEWLPLKVTDDTKAFTRSGTVVFAGPQDFARSSIFTRELYWIRIVNLDGRFELNEASQKPLVNGIYMNSAGVVQHRSIKNEMIETVAGQDDREYHLSMFPVISEEVWVNEAEHPALGQPDIPTGKTEGVQVVKDPIGNILELWVKWDPVEDFGGSGPEDRHYIINRITGALRFGDGRNGRIPPCLGRDNVKINYKIGGGAQGNVGSFEINSLQNSIVFVDQVINPEPSGGGCDTETLERAMQRGPQYLRHRNRAVTAEDFEWLAREASQDIARVKCLPNINTWGKKESGCVAVVVVPKGAGKGSPFFPALKRQVERYLVERSAATVSFQNKIQVIEPVYLEISVHAHLAVNEADYVAVTEKEALERLNSFLDPLTGNFEGQGWEIGQYPHISVFYTLLKAVKNVNFIENVSIVVDKVEEGVRSEINPGSLGDLPHGMVMNGRHLVIVNML